MLARPIVPLSNRDLGYLPGDVQDKLAPYMKPLFDNLSVIRHQFPENDPRSEKISEMLAAEKLVISPLSYIRGRSLQRMYFIIDEAQNLTPHEVKTIITRAGEGTKIVLTGDIQQIDQPYLDGLSNGLSHLINRMVGQPIYAHISLARGERSMLADVASDLLLKRAISGRSLVIRDSPDNLADPRRWPAHICVRFVDLSCSRE